MTLRFADGHCFRRWCNRDDKMKQSAGKVASGGRTAGTIAGTAGKRIGNVGGQMIKDLMGKIGGKGATLNFNLKK